jgi:hypothetical protein
MSRRSTTFPDEPAVDELLLLLGRSLAEQRGIRPEYSSLSRSRSLEPQIHFEPADDTTSTPWDLETSLSTTAQNWASIYSSRFRRKVVRLGRAYVELLEDPLYRVLCSDQSDPRFIKRLRSATADGATAAVGVIALHIEAQLGIRQELTVVVAWVVVRSFLKGSHDDLCKNWTQARGDKSEHGAKRWPKKTQTTSKPKESPTRQKET